MDDKNLTIIINVLLVIFGAIQIIFLRTQKKHTRIALTEQYRNLWYDFKKHWGIVVFIGRDEDEYYQVLNKKTISKLKEEIIKGDVPTIWALESTHKVCGLLGEVSTRILQGHLEVSDVYPIFGTEFLRQSRPLRQLLEPEYESFFTTLDINEKHTKIRKELQDWLVYHDGLRRRCLILIDLLWAEAARLEDLPPYDMESAADAKRQTGHLNKKRILEEIIRLNGVVYILFALRLSNFLNRAQYRSVYNWSGISKKRISSLNAAWTKRILREN